MFVKGDKVLHSFNRDFGPGEVVSVDGSRMEVHFPRLGRTMVFAASGESFVPLVAPEGSNPQEWAESWSDDLAERLLRYEVESGAALLNRCDALRLRSMREAGGLGSYLGGRIRLFPHQLHVAELASRSDPVRWLLADEVGLGKTIEACLILSRLLRTGRVESVLIAAPGTLVVQWLGELYRKFHQVFVLLDAARRGDVHKDLGPEFNPFAVHQRGVISMEDLVQDPAAARAALEDPPDLLIVDEAHRLERRPGHPGSAAYRALAPLVAASRHVLLLSATPLEADTHGFYRLLELLRPEAYGGWEEFRDALQAGRPLVACTSATTRADIGGLPPRVPRRVEIGAWPELTTREAAALARPSNTPVRLREREEALEKAAGVPARGDPRLAWLASEAPAWKRRRQKTLIFVAGRSSLEQIKGEMEFVLRERVAVFHEDLSLAQRDLEVARFGSPEGPSILISTECGGEGRNFEFCRRLILFDLPWSPLLVEQRIGRLDRIIRARPVEVVYFVPPAGFARCIVEVYERLGVFRMPLGGLDHSLAHVEGAIRAAARQETPTLDVEAIVRETDEVRAAAERGIYRHLHQNAYRPEMAQAILDRIPPDLEIQNEHVIVEACRLMGFEVADRAEQRTWYFEYGPLATVDGLPGISAGQRWLGTFDRETAVRRESLDFFASGHPLVEAILQELVDGRRGQVALLRIEGAATTGMGFGVVSWRSPELILQTWDASGTPRPEWIPFLAGEKGRASDLHPSRFEPPAGWAEMVRQKLRETRVAATPMAVAGFVLTH